MGLHITLLLSHGTLLSHAAQAPVLSASLLAPYRNGGRRLLRRIETFVKDLPWIASRRIPGLTTPDALAFYAELANSGFESERLIKVMPRHKVIYVAVPKSASTQIRETLARVEGRFHRTLKASRRAEYRGPYGPRNITVGAFHKLATANDTLRFSFVRNPYARAVSCWADKFAGKPLIAGDPYVDSYLAVRRNISRGLPYGPNRSLSFADYCQYAAAATGHDIHIQTQAAILDLPGLKFDFIGKVENFAADFSGVLDHLNASADIRRAAMRAANMSEHDDWRKYYTPGLAAIIHRTYERDFERFGYARDVDIAADRRLAVRSR